MTEAVQRRLVAILALDVVGFSRLMEIDEEGTYARLKLLRTDLIEPAIAANQGRIFKTTGDGLLAEFSSVVAAVKYAVQVQIAMREQARDVPSERRLLARIGINLGDVIPEGDDIFGEGVNIAVRIEGLCDPGCIALSASAYEHVHAKFEGMRFVDRGEHRVKNIARPVHVYSLDPGGGRVARRRLSAKTRRRAMLGALALVAGVALFVLQQFPDSLGAFLTGEALPPTRRAIAVLPFSNQSGDNTRDYFSSGVAEDLTNALSRFSELMVISNNAVSSFRDGTTNAADIGRKLGVRYIVQGSVREAAGKLRIGVVLADANKGVQLWSEHYDGDAADVFQIQDRVVSDIAGVLAVKVSTLEQQRIATKAPGSLEAYDLVLKARGLLKLSQRGANREARGLLEKALVLNPGYAEAYLALSIAEYQRGVVGWTDDPAEAISLSQQWARRALANDDVGTHARAHALLGRAYSATRKYDEALHEVDRAIALNASDALAYAERGGVLLWLGRIHEAVLALETALKFDPQLDMEYAINLALAYYMAERYLDVVTICERFSLQERDNAYLLGLEAAASSKLGKADAAHALAVRAKSSDLQIQLDEFATRFMNPALSARAQSGLREAGFSR